MFRWQCTARWNGHRRNFDLYAANFEQAKQQALHLVGHHYALYSGRIGSQVWSEGVITLSGEGIEPVIIFEHAF